MKKFLTIVVFIAAVIHTGIAQRIPVLNQVKLPHNYYYRELYFPQLTSGPSSVAWSADGKHLVYSMNGSLWIQEIGTMKAVQLTDEEGYDYQPDVSPDGKKIVFVRYNGTSTEIMTLDLASGVTRPLTENKAVNLEPRWSPDGGQIAFVSTANSGNFLLHMARFEQDKITDIRFLDPDQTSKIPRYYYSPIDHSINPVWARDGKKIYFVSNHEIAHGTGDIVSLDLDTKEIKTIRHEETSWRTNPDISPDGTRMVYSSYLGRNWNQLWMIPVSRGDYPIPLTYGEYDNTRPRWSPDGKKIAFISNRGRNTSLWLTDVYDGLQQKVTATDLQYLKPRTKLEITVVDEKGGKIASRISVTDSRGKFHAPADAWIQADDSRYPTQARFESHYFHGKGTDTLMVPHDRLVIHVSHGPEFEIVKKEIDVTGVSTPVTITLKNLPTPPGYGSWWSGDLHVHMNYGGNYRSAPEKVVGQAGAENLNFIFNMVVNKEQRVPDVSYFTPSRDPASNAKTILLHAQEFHTSFWGHLGLLRLDHLIVPGYSGYPETAASSLFPHNGFIADRAHAQNGLVGYVHPFETSEVIPDQAPTLFNELPVDIALGKVNYYELIGFSDHKASEKVWYQLLNCGFRIAAGAGTDAMTNYSNLRGPVGLCRVFVKAEGNPDENLFLDKVIAGQSYVTNGPLIGFVVNGKNPGDSISISAKGESLSYSAYIRSQVPVDHFEVIWNGEVVASHQLTGTRTTGDVQGSIRVKGPGWMVLRAWNDIGHPDLPDLYLYASTNPVYVEGRGVNTKQKEAAAYFLKWVDRIETKANELAYRNGAEKQLVIDDIRRAKNYYIGLVK